MSVLKKEDSKKWINGLIAIGAILSGFIAIRFVETLGEWFDLEAKVGNFLVLSQGLGVFVGLSIFFIIFKNKKAMAYLNEVYSELVKVVWTDRDSTVKTTIGIVIGISIVSGIFILVDYIFQKLLSLIY